MVLKTLEIRQIWTIIPQRKRDQLRSEEIPLLFESEMTPKSSWPAQSKLSGIALDL